MESSVKGPVTCPQANAFQMATDEPRTTLSQESWHQQAVRNLAVEEPSLFRGMPATRAMRSFASVFSNRPPTAEYYDLSYTTEHLDHFISHNWGTPRWRKFLVLAFYFNLPHAISASLLVAASTCALVAYAELPVVQLTGYTSEEGRKHYQGVYCLPVGLATFFIVLFGLHELDVCPSLPWRRPLVFLDKTCVHQVDMERKKKGIESLAAFLSRSKIILVLYSDIYFERLWTTYEVATWLLLRRGSRMAVRPVQQPMALLYGFLAMSLFKFFSFFSSAVELQAVVHPAPGFLFTALLPLQAFFLAVVVILARWEENYAKMEVHISNFTLAKAKCVSEDDRSVVCRNIVAFMKYTKLSPPDVPLDRACADFEELVRREVPGMMRKSFGRVGLPYAWALLLPLPDMLGGFDYYAGFLRASTPARRIVLALMYRAALFLCAAPLMVGFAMKMARHRRFVRTTVGIICAALISNAVFSCYLIAFDFMTYKANESDTWLVLLSLLYGVLVVATFIVYRPYPKLLDERGSGRHGGP